MPHRADLVAVCRVVVLSSKQRHRYPWNWTFEAISAAISINLGFFAVDHLPVRSPEHGPSIGQALYVYSDRLPEHVSIGCSNLEVMQVGSDSYTEGWAETWLSEAFQFLL
jgi:hypothetical protein